MRDHTRLKVFELADRLVMSVYRESADFPTLERYGLQSQLRRAAVAVAADIVEGCAGATQAEHLRSLDIAYGSARELQCEFSLCGRLGFLSPEVARRLDDECTSTAKALSGLLRALR